MRAIFELDKLAVRHSFAVAAETYDEMAVLQRQVGLELLGLYQAKYTRGNLLDLGCGTGFLTQQLLNVLPKQVQVYALDFALSMCQAANNKNNGNTNVAMLCADAETLPFKSQCMEAVYSNLALQWCLSLSPLFLDIHRVLKPGGQFAMSTFGSATLHELKSAWNTVDAYTHVNDFCDAEQLASLLKQAGFNDVTLQTRKHVLFYLDVISLMKELKAIGAHNASANRKKQLTGKRQLQKMIAAYEQLQVEDRIPATYEVIYLTAKRD